MEDEQAARFSAGTFASMFWYVTVLMQRMLLVSMVNNFTNSYKL